MENGVYFKNRIDAASKLSQLLSKYKNNNAVVLGIPRGGVITGKVVSDYLSLPLGLLLVRKIGHPNNPEYAIAAVSESGIIEKSSDLTDIIDDDWLRSEVNKQLLEIKRRRKKYWGSRKSINLNNKTVLIVDDGMATGLTMMAAIKEVQKFQPYKIIVAVPVCPKDTAVLISSEVDDFVCCSIPELFSGAVGSYYDDFPQVEDEEVIKVLNKPNDPILFFMPQFRTLAEKISDLPNFNMGEMEVINFPNLEFQIRINSNVKDLNTVYIGTISPPYIQTLRSLITCHTIKKEGSSYLLAIFPYLSFMRHDKDKPHEDQATDLIGKFIEDAGISKIITFDIHSIHDLDFFEVPIESLSTTSIFVEKIKLLNFSDSVVVAPDHGAIDRADALRIGLGINTPLVSFSKKREVGKKLTSVFVHGEVHKRAIVVDDILDTGQTLLNCVKTLKEKGVEEIIIAVTHGLFTGDKWKKIFNYGVKKIYVSDTIPSVITKASESIEIVPIYKLVQNKLREINLP